ncbi:putative EF-hand domain pair protein [Arabidopsis thaliana]
MARGESEGESSGSERESSSSSSGNESEPIKGKISEYEKQRLSRIAENKARLDALGIPAIALSLQGFVAGGSRTKNTRSDKEAATMKKKRQGGKGFITRRDVAKMATVHDFTWTEEELQDMIRSFDMDKDGKVGTKLKVFTFIRETLLLNIFNFGQLSCRSSDGTGRTDRSSDGMDREKCSRKHKDKCIRTHPRVAHGCNLTGKGRKHQEWVRNVIHHIGSTSRPPSCIYLLSHGETDQRSVRPKGDSMDNQRESPR